MTFGIMLTGALGVLLFVCGIIKKSQMTAFLSSNAVLVVALYFSGLSFWMTLLPLVPAAALPLSFTAKKKAAHG
ncbi:hypothetical protein [Alteribacter keqinensis]|uniref:Uncharacterized protein n=1 Tax=Alteribacter keqinensis TaxID=2483800 RepID=A0A3M7TPA8_9BACI|nr:hypothetical protein [Alteribacter keqinensis]RNA66976.1 hypothetical protein EBO34_17430 [Alteribacter keqinensis]